MRALHIFPDMIFSIRRLISAIAALSMILLIIFSFSTIATAGHANAAQRQTQTTYESIYITGGDTLWKLAKQYGSTTDTRQFVEQIKELNGLSSDHIQAGTYLLIPVEHEL